MRICFVAAGVALIAVVFVAAVVAAAFIAAVVVVVDVCAGFALFVLVAGVCVGLAIAVFAGVFAGLEVVVFVVVFIVIVVVVVAIVGFGGAFRVFVLARGGAPGSGAAADSSERSSSCAMYERAGAGSRGARPGAKKSAKAGSGKGRTCSPNASKSEPTSVKCFGRCKATEYSWEIGRKKKEVRRGTQEKKRVEDATVEAAAVGCKFNARQGLPTKATWGVIRRGGG